LNAMTNSMRDKRSVIGQGSVAIFFAQEGLFDFAQKSWGPQPVRLLMAVSSCAGLGLAVAKDTGVREIKDIKGKRVGVVVDFTATRQGILGLIAFAGLTADDVTLVEFASYEAMMKGAINNQVDVVLTSTISPQAKELGDSPRGIYWPTMMAQNKAGWERVHKLAPYFSPVIATCGAGDLDKDPAVMAGHPFPFFWTFADRPAATIYAITKGMVDTFDAYKDKAPGADGMAMDRQVLERIVPYHDGAIRLFKETEDWDEWAQQNHDAVIARQKVLADAWKAYKSGAPADDKAFTAGWMKARAAALRKAGMTPYYE
jgi:TRAP transporter TAXI family solute receptor